MPWPPDEIPTDLVEALCTGGEWHEVTRGSVAIKHGVLFWKERTRVYAAPFSEVTAFRWTGDQ